nr:hypothetical protein [Tanacetum cinerariifolium]
MNKVHCDKRKEVHARLDFGEGSRERRFSPLKCQSPDYKARKIESTRPFEIRDRSHHMKRRRDNESPLSSVSKSDSSDG